MNFIQVWLTGYRHPGKAFEELGLKPAPHWGFYATLLRIIGILTLSYLPALLLKHQISPSSYITLLPTENYYVILLFLAPAVHLANWLMLTALAHLILRLMGHPGGMDQLLNIHGMTALMVWPVLQIFDWAAILLGGRSEIFLGISHVLIDLLLYMTLALIGYKRLLQLPIRTGLLLIIVQLLVGIPIAALFLRMP